MLKHFRECLQLHMLTQFPGFTKDTSCLLRTVFYMKTRTEWEEVGRIEEGEGGSMDRARALAVWLIHVWLIRRPLRRRDGEGRSRGMGGVGRGRESDSHSGNCFCRQCASCSLSASHLAACATDGATTWGRMRVGRSGQKRVVAKRKNSSFPCPAVSAGYAPLCICFGPHRGCEEPQRLVTARWSGRD